MKNLIFSILICLLFPVFGFGQKLNMYLSKSSIENTLNAMAASGLLSKTASFSPPFSYQFSQDIGPFKFEFGTLTVNQVSIGFNQISFEPGTENDSSFTLTLKNANIWTVGSIYVSSTFPVSLLNQNLNPHFNADVILKGSIRVKSEEGKDSLMFIVKSETIPDIYKLVSETSAYEFATFLGVLPNIEADFTIIKEIKFPLDFAGISQFIQPNRAIQILAQPDGISIFKEYKVEKPVNETYNLVGTRTDLGTVQLKKPSLAVWDAPVKSSFGILDQADSGSVFQGKSIEKTIPFSGITYLYKDHAGTIDDGDQITINYTGVR